jgi:hypothetical protein
MRRLITLIAAVALLPNLCFAWGRGGHQIIATIAEDNLTQPTKVMIQSLIGNNHLYSIASWADEIRNQRREMAPWHYVNIPLGSRYEAKHDCPAPKGCVVKKLNEFFEDTDGQEGIQLTNPFCLG